MAAIPLEREEEAKRGVTLEEGAVLSAVPLVPHGGFWFDSELVKSIQLVQAQFAARPDDVILARYPKCGTTWLKALAFAITNRSRHTFAQHPLLSRHPQDVVPSLETPYRQCRPLAADLDDDVPSPRLLATHIPLSLLPSSVAATTGYRIVYLCREPKDVLVSMWHFANRVYDRLSVDLSLLFHFVLPGGHRLRAHLEPLS